MKRKAEILSHLLCETQNGQVLDYDGINSCLLHLHHGAGCLVKLFLVQYCIESDKNAATESVGMAAQDGKVLHAVSGRSPCSELRPCHIHGIGTAVDCRDADILIPCRSKKFE